MVLNHTRQDAEGRWYFAALMRFILFSAIYVHCQTSEYTLHVTPGGLCAQHYLISS